MTFRGGGYNLLTPPPRVRHWFWNVVKSNFCISGFCICISTITYRMTGLNSLLWQDGPMIVETNYFRLGLDCLELGFLCICILFSLFLKSKLIVRRNCPGKLCLWESMAKLMVIFICIKLFISADHVSSFKFSGKWIWGDGKKIQNKIAETVTHPVPFIFMIRRRPTRATW